MISRLREIEDAYLGLFCEIQILPDKDLFCNSTVPGMYDHNFVLIKDLANPESIRKYIADCLQDVKNKQRNFLKIVFHPTIKVPADLFDWATQMGFEVSKINYMGRPITSDTGWAEESCCVVKRAKTADEIEMGLECAVKYRTSPITAAKLSQKRQLYLNQSIFYYICYVNGEPVGYCDWFEQEGVVKFEEFVVLNEYQGKGYGTKMLQKMLTDAAIQGNRYAYVVTDAEGSEHNLYYKMGFDFVGDETELFFME